MLSLFNRFNLFFSNHLSLVDDCPFNVFMNKLIYSINFLVIFLLTSLIFDYFDFQYFLSFYVFSFALIYYALFSFYSVTSLYAYLLDFSLSIRERVCFSAVFLIFSFIYIYLFFSFLFSFFFTFYDAGFFSHYRIENGLN